MLRRLLLLLAIIMTPGVANAAPSCMPGLYGEQVGNADYARTDDGWYAYGYCRKPDGFIEPFILACVHGSCLPIGTFVDRVTSMKRGANPVATLKAAWDAEVGGKCETASGALKTVCDHAYEAARLNFPVGELPPPPPPAERWAVAPSTTGQRPSSQVVDGVRVSMKTPVYVPVGSECLPAVAPTFVTTAGTWMAVKDQPENLRWLCKKR